MQRARQLFRGFRALQGLTESWKFFKKEPQHFPPTFSIAFQKRCEPRKADRFPRPTVNHKQVIGKPKRQLECRRVPLQEVRLTTDGSRVTEAAPRVLIAEDDPVSARMMELALSRAGFQVERADNGEAALKALSAKAFDALVTDWLMPEMDGIELCRRVRAEVPHRPAVLMITALASAESRTKALASGADDFLAKPAEPSSVVNAVKAAVARRNQPSPSSALLQAVPRHGSVPFVALGIAASTGGPAALSTLISLLQPGDNTRTFVVQHGPVWMMDDLVVQLQQHSRLKIVLASPGLRPEADQVLIAPGSRHMILDHDTYRIRLLDTVAENYVKPAADPLFRSLAAACGPFAICAVLTGLGRDGGVGAVEVASRGGSVFIQAPADCVAPHMPQTVLDLGIAKASLPLAELAARINEETKRLGADLAAAL
jgi:two-component system, chemotaxis family, protein-glutamate methylesterase/glutaminase